MKKVKEQLHKMPLDLKEMIESSKKLSETWKTITPIAKNEWICWVTSPKKQETRKHRIEVGKSKLLSGEKRPCCWPGCPHRNPNAEKWFNTRKKDK